MIQGASHANFGKNCSNRTVVAHSIMNKCIALYNSALSRILSHNCVWL